MDIHHIRYFLSVCDTLNFTRAADNSNVTQPALSRAVQQLEEELGGRLFLRDRGTTQITEFGAMMRPRLQQVMDEMQAVRKEVDRFLTLEEAHFTLGVLRTVGPTRLTGFLSHFRMCYPGIKLRIIEGTQDELAGKLENGTIDVALLSRAGNFPERFDIRALYRERYLIAAAIDHRFASMKEIPLREVDGEIYLLRSSCELADHFTDLITSAHYHVDKRFASEREDWILNMVAGGMGICCIPEFSALVPGIATRPIIDPEVWREVCIATMAGRRLSPALLGFMKAIKDYPWPQSRFEIEHTAVAMPSQGQHVHVGKV